MCVSTILYKRPTLTRGAIPVAVQCVNKETPAYWRQFLRQVMTTNVTTQRSIPVPLLAFHVSSIRRGVNWKNWRYMSRDHVMPNIRWWHDSSFTKIRHFAKWHSLNSNTVFRFNVWHCAFYKPQLTDTFKWKCKDARTSEHHTTQRKEQVKVQTLYRPTNAHEL